MCLYVGFLRSQLGRVKTVRRPQHIFMWKIVNQKHTFFSPPLNYHMIQNSVVQKGEELRAEWEKQNMVNPDYFHFA